MFFTREIGSNRRPVELAVPAVHLGQGLREFATITFGEASHDIDRAYHAIGFCLDTLKNHFNGFLFGVTYEATGVDNHITAAETVGIETHIITGVSHNAGKTLRIDKILGASHGYDIQSFLFRHEKRGFIPIRFRKAI